MSRLKDTNWNCGELGSMDIDHAQLAGLMDIRDELKQLNRVFASQNFVAMPRHAERTRMAVEGLRRDFKKAKVT